MRGSFRSIKLYALSIPMILRRYTSYGPSFWTLDGLELPQNLTLGFLLSLPKAKMIQTLKMLAGEEAYCDAAPAAPIESDQEVWASGVTYLRSRVEREAESNVADVYARVYDAQRPEIFFKTQGWRVKGTETDIRIRRDSDWNVPEPELTLVINAHKEIVGYTVGNDVSSRSIEGENPLYLPQAKSYDGSCALGPGIEILEEDSIAPLSIHLEIRREGVAAFTGESSTAEMKRAFPELVGYLTSELTFPQGVFLMTGTGIVPSHPFTLEKHDVVIIKIGDLTLENTVGDNTFYNLSK